MRSGEEGLEEPDRCSDDVPGCKGVWRLNIADAVQMGIRAAEKEELGVFYIQFILGVHEIGKNEFIDEIRK